MRRMLPVFLAVMIAAGAANAAPKGYIALFADEERTTWCVSQSVEEIREYFVFCLPSDDGQSGAEFSIAVDEGYYQILDETVAPFVTLNFGYLRYPGSSYVFNCRYDQYGWFWLTKFRVRQILPHGASMVVIAPHFDTGLIKFASCLPGRPTETPIVLTNIYVNYPPDSPECQGVGTQEASWGAIKSQYR